MANVTERERQYLYVEGDNDTSIDVLPPVAGEVTYTAEEFAAKSWQVFNTGPDVVVAAFIYAGLTTATKAQAIDLVEAFCAKEI